MATVDALNGLVEDASLKQAAVADVLVVTKVDVAEPDGLETRLRALNPGAEIVEAAFGEIEPGRLFDRPHTDPRDVSVGERHAHEGGIRPFALVFEERLDWTAFGIWLTMLLQARGSRPAARQGAAERRRPRRRSRGPLLLNGVQHVVHPPEHLDAWPDDDHRSRIVFIGRGLDPAAVERSLLAFNAAAH